jgi:predicted nuclease with RNAse H fold
MVYGKREEDLEAMLAGTAMIPLNFRKYTIPRRNAPAMHRELETMGVSFSNVYPDLTGIATELRLRLGPPPAHKFCKKCEERRAKT